MLNALKLSELLAKNVDPQLYPRMFVMSPNGTLMAYSTPVDIKDLRDQAALISMAWKEHETQHLTARRQPSNPDDDADPDTARPPQGLETLTIEFQSNNIIVRAIQPKLLLVLVGGVPPSRKISFKITAETYGDPRYPSTDVPSSPSPTLESAALDQAADGELSSGETSNPSGDESGASLKRKQKAASVVSSMSQREKDVKIGALHIQRKKIDALTEFIRRDFDERGFVMPDDSNFP
ncbi:hypothetical protein K491DRAFT_768660 [Lophiostoma macrostomum CBS 122681]|uniref:Uncharacterized protein n=1 Tax=Lophiostoma macrostomum CBS 122681 TaxID=1314788 RepID=A0A6A6T546_9PLEO|nr:hypothetical protein K491DRAFT_768660 [Lophiostoma macrostomum CBS 122681]